MRMWMVDPKIMCRKHLLGEHLELHMFVGTINKGISIQGYLDKNLLEPLGLIGRHALLVEEMTRRGYNHQSPLPRPVIPIHQQWVIIDREMALTDLLSRCEDCRKRRTEHQMSMNTPLTHFIQIKTRRVS